MVKIKKHERGKNILNAKYLGEDFWGNETVEVKFKGKKHILKKVDGVFHTTTSYGEPGIRISKKYKVVVKK